MTIQQKCDQYRQLEECILSGQVSESNVFAAMEADPEFAAWIRDRASARQDAPKEQQIERQSTSPIDLLSPAVWLHRWAQAAEQASTVASEPADGRLLREDGARLVQACQIVKECTDRERHE
jgi:hypothetical protein